MAELIDVASPLLQRFDAELLLSGPGHAPVHLLLNVLLSLEPTSEDFANAAAFAFDLPADRRELWANLLLKHLAACRDAATPTVLESVLRLLNGIATMGLLRCLASAPIAPEQRGELISMAGVPDSVVSELAEEAADDGHLAPLLVDVVALSKHPERLADTVDLVLRLPEQLLSRINVANLNRLREGLPAQSPVAVKLSHLMLSLGSSE